MLKYNGKQTKKKNLYSTTTTVNSENYCSHKFKKSCQINNNQQINLEFSALNKDEKKKKIIKYYENFNNQKQFQIRRNTLICDLKQKNEKALEINNFKKNFRVKSSDFHSYIKLSLGFILEE